MGISLWTVLFAMFWKSGVLLGAALVINWTLNRRLADLRRLVLSATIVALLLAAATAPLLPHWKAVMPLWPGLSQPKPAVDTPDFLIPAETPQQVAPKSREPIGASFSRVEIGAWLTVLIWFAGAATLSTRFALNLRELHWLRKASHPLAETGVLPNRDRLGRRVCLCQNDRIGAPATWGILRPVIVVPAGFEDLPEESRNAVIRHEAAHIQAHDFLMRSLAEIARALIWFQPLIWIVCRQLREEQELACDNYVLAAGGKPSAYARLLLDWDARRGVASLVAAGIARQSCMKRRLYALLDPDLRRDTVGRPGTAGLFLLALAGSIPLASVAFSQSPRPPLPRAQVQAAHTADTRPHFDVVSIKPCNPGATSGTPVFAGGSSPGSLRINCGILADTDNVGLIQLAYNRYARGGLTSTAVIPVEGGPDWIHSERYDIEAKATGDPNLLLMQGPMLQTILEDRFKLKVHKESRQGPVYELVLGKGSPKLKPLRSGACVPAIMGSPLPVLAEGQHRCRNLVSPGGAVDIEGGTLTMLAGLLGMVLDRPVIDKTGITGYFEMRLTFSPDGFHRPDPAAPGAPTPANASDKPGIFQAIQEQLGLRLAPARGPNEVLVIDHVEKPSQN